jgi:hypothetical protein
MAMNPTSGLDKLLGSAPVSNNRPNTGYNTDLIYWKMELGKAHPEKELRENS